MSDIGERLAAVHRRIAAACDKVDRDPTEVVLVAVSKTRTQAELLAAYAAGQRQFGENRVQEARDKSQDNLPADVVLRLIGHLQKNKIKAASDVFQAVDSIDDLETLHRLDRLASRPIDALIQVKLDESAHRHGASPRQLAELVGQATSLAHLRVRGLMLVPPVDSDPRPFFRELRRLRDSLGGVEVLPELSMGMSHDFECAIEEGATMVRLGEVIFGARATTR